MTTKELKERLRGIPDDYPVVVMNFNESTAKLSYIECEKIYLARYKNKKSELEECLIIE